jgi:hypothetical protein
VERLRITSIEEFDESRDFDGPWIDDCDSAAKSLTSPAGMKRKEGKKKRRRELLSK